MDAEKKLTESNNKVTTSKDKFQSLLVAKSNNIKLIDELEEKIEDLIISLRKIVDEKELDSNVEQKISTASYATGMYMIKFTDTQHVETQKLLIKH